MKRLLLIFIPLLLLAASCGNNCYVPQRAQAGVAFMDSTGLQPKDLYRVTVKGMGNDSLLYDAVASLSVIYLPLKNSETSTQFEVTCQLSSDEGAMLQNYLLTIQHTNYPQLISPECGCVMFHTITDAQFVGQEGASMVEIYNPQVVNIEQDVHIKVSL